MNTKISLTVITLVFSFLSTKAQIYYQHSPKLQRKILRKMKKGTIIDREKLALEPDTNTQYKPSERDIAEAKILKRKNKSDKWIEQKLEKLGRKYSKDFFKANHFFKTELEAIRNNQLLPNDTVYRAFLADAVSKNWETFEGGNADYNTLFELTPEQIIGLLKIINNPTLFPKAEVGTNAMLSRIYFMNRESIFFDVELWGYWTIKLAGNKFVLGSMLDEKSIKILQTWLGTLKDNQAKPETEIVEKIKLYDEKEDND